MISRAGFWWRVLGTAKLHRSGWFWLFVAVVVAIPAGFVFLQGIVDYAVGWAAVLSETLVVVGTTVALCRARVASAAPVFDRLDLLLPNGADIHATLDAISPRLPRTAT